MLQQIQQLFPHATIRAGQDQLINDLDAAFTERKILLAHAPTGLGKTASALTVAVQHALEHNKKIFFLTNRHTQHQIAVNTLKLMKDKTGKAISCADLIGKKWMCSQDVAELYGNEFNEFCKTVVEKGECEFYSQVHQSNKFTAEAKLLLHELKLQGPLHNEEIMERSKAKKMCSYEIALALARKATVIIGDYYYVFNPFVQNMFFQKLNLQLEDIILIVDEAHNLPARITNLLSNNLTTIMLRNALQEAKKHQYPGLMAWLQGLTKILQDLAVFSLQDKGKEKKVQKDDFVDKVKKIASYDTIIKELEIAAEEVRSRQQRSYLGGIAAFLDAWRGEDQSYTRIITERESNYGLVISLSYACLDPSIISKEIFSQAHAGILMSGTLNPTFMYKDLLGIEQGREKEYASPFPPENKLTLIIPETSTKYSLRGDEMYQRIAVKCAELVSLIPGNVALFFPSYQLRDRIAEYFPGLRLTKKLFWEKREMGKQEKEQLLNDFRQEQQQGGVLLGVAGANFAEGIDLPGNLLNGVIVVGLPLARPDLKTREVIAYYDEKFGNGWNYGYVYPAITKCLQSAGRCIRSETDQGAVIFLDERFAWQGYFCCFPREGVRVSKEYVPVLKEFFKKESRPTLKIPATASCVDF